MNIILVPKRGGRYNTYRFGSNFLILFAFVGVLITSGVLTAGYFFGKYHAGLDTGPTVIVSELKRNDGTAPDN